MSGAHKPSMPIFFFHFRNGAEYVHDEEGLELADVSAALNRGVANLRDVLAGDVLSGVLDTDASIEIADESRNHFATIRFDDVLWLKPAQQGSGRRSSLLDGGIPVNDD